MSEAWTDKQSLAIKARNKNILVSAAAGSGKTAVLVERIKQLIIDENVPVDTIFVATFTNAAAGELKERIAKAIKRAIAEGESDRSFLKSQLGKVYKANISTFHSFAIEVIRRYFYVVDTDPDFKICDDAEKTILMDAAMEELFEEKFDSGDAGFIDFIKSYCTVKSEKKAKDMIMHLHETIQALPGPFEWLKEKVGVQDGDDKALYEFMSPFIMEHAVKELEYALSAFQRAYNALSEAGLSGNAAKCAIDIEALTSVLNSAAAGYAEETERKLREMSFQRYGGGRLRDKGKARVKELADAYFSSDFADEAAEIRAACVSIKTLMGLTIDFDGRFREKKREKALLDFNDIEHLALAILKNQGVSHEYRNKFKYIFVDEYQDSNLIQEEMISLIKSGDNVFMVGDVKQSIYKFRLAEPEIFMKKYESFRDTKSDGDLKIDLNTNFRCKENIIDAVNDICIGIMPYDEDSALRKGVSYSGPLDYPVSLHVIESKEIVGDRIDSEINELKKAELEAGVVAKLIRDVVGREIYEESAKAERRVGFKDIVILMRSVKSFGEKYFQTLTDNNIPAYIDDSDGYFDTIEIEIFMNLLKVLDNKRRDMQLISVLHSGIMGFSADELSKIRIICMGTPYHKAFDNYIDLGDDPALREKCRHAHERLLEWRSLSLSMALDEFIWKLLWDTGFYIYAGALPGGDQRQANLRALTDKALKYINAHEDGLFGFIQYAETLRRKGVQIGQASLSGESGDVVRIKTIHKSKGLEFPVVIVSGLGKRFMSGRERSEISIHKDIGVGLRDTLLQSVIADKNKRESMEEEARILYVALTRAKDMLILVGTVTDIENMPPCYLDMIMPIFLEKKMKCDIYGRKDVVIGKARSGAAKDEFRKKLTEGEEPLSGREAESLIQSRLSFEYPDKSALTAKSKYSVSEIGRSGDRSNAEKDAAAPLFLQGKKKPTGAEIGSAIHVFMDRLDFKKASRLFDSGDKAGREYLSGLLDELAEKVILVPEVAGLIDLGLIEGFIKSDIGRRAARADELFKETAFNVLKEIDGIETMIQGVIDCYFEEDGEYVLIDYKSDFMSGDEDVGRIKETYAGQVSLYGEALETMKNVRVKEKYLYLLRKGIAVPLDD